MPGERKKAVTLPCSADHLVMLSREIGKVRAWLSGFQAAGKAGPPGEDALRQIQILIQTATPHD